VQCVEELLDVEDPVFEEVAEAAGSKELDRVVRFDML
jgi:hypothetical protein